MTLSGRRNAWHLVIRSPRQRRHGTLRLLPAAGRQPIRAAGISRGLPIVWRLNLTPQRFSLLPFLSSSIVLPARFPTPDFPSSSPPSVKMSAPAAFSDIAKAANDVCSSQIPLAVPSTVAEDSSSGRDFRANTRRNSS